MSGSNRRPVLSKKSQKRARKEALENLEEERLTALLFGAGDVNNDGPSIVIEDRHDENKIGIEQYGEESKHDFTFEIDRDGGKRSIENDDDEPSNIEKLGHDDDEKGNHSDIMKEKDDDDEIGRAHV